MFKNAIAIACLAVGINGAAHAAIIGADAFLAPITINFETASAGMIGSQFSEQGIKFTNFGLATFQTSSAPASRVALKYDFNNPSLDGVLLFASPITRLGFDATSNPEDDTTLFAYLGNDLVGTTFFDTFGDGQGGSFLGIEFASGFDRVIVRTDTVINGALAIDNVRFEAVAINTVPEPGMFSLMAIAMAAMVAFLRRRG